MYYGSGGSVIQISLHCQFYIQPTAGFPAFLPPPVQLHSKFRQFPTVCKLLARGLCHSVSSALLSLRKSSRSNVNWLHRATRFMKWQSLLLELRGNCHKLHRRHKKSNYIQAAVQLPGSGPTPANLGHTGRSKCNNTTTSATTTPNNFRRLQNTSKKTKKKRKLFLGTQVETAFLILSCTQPISPGMKQFPSSIFLCIFMRISRALRGNSTNC